MSLSYCQTYLDCFVSGRKITKLQPVSAPVPSKSPELCQMECQTVTGMYIYPLSYFWGPNKRVGVKLDLEKNK